MEVKTYLYEDLRNLGMFYHFYQKSLPKFIEVTFP